MATQAEKAGEQSAGERTPLMAKKRTDGMNLVAMTKAKIVFKRFRGKNMAMPFMPAVGLDDQTLATPDNASSIEAFRDCVLRAAGHKIVSQYLAVIWVILVVCVFVWYAIMVLGLHGIPFVADADLYTNISVNILSGLFSYVVSVDMPWRLSNAVHLCGGAEPGSDFYGRQTDCIWFHIPLQTRAWIVFAMLNNAGWQYVHQVLHIIYIDFHESNKMPAIWMLPTTMILSAGGGFVAAVLQIYAETKLRWASPEAMARFGPGVVEKVLDFWDKFTKHEQPKDDCLDGKSCLDVGKGAAV